MSIIRRGSGSGTSPVNDNVSRATSNVSNTRGGFATSPRVPTGKTTPQQLQTILYSQEYGTYPKQAVVEQNQTYFAYFDGVGSTNPEIIDQTAYFVKYIIDDRGNPVNPEPDFAGTRDQAVGLYNLIDDYEVGKRAIIKLIEPNPLYDDIPKNSDVLTGVHKITGVGRIAPIAITETGKKIEDYVATMSFGPLEIITTETTVTNLYYSSQWLGGNEIIEKTSPLDDGEAALKYISPLSNNPAWEIHTPPGYNNSIRILSSSADTYTRIRFNITAYVGVENPDNDWYENNFRFKLRHYNSSFTNLLTEFISNWYWIGEDNAGYFTYVTDWIDSYNSGDIFLSTVQVQSESDDDNGNDYTSGAYVYYRGASNATGTKIIVEQETPSTTVVDTGEETIIEVPLTNGVNAIYSPFFTASLNIVNSDSSGSGYTAFNSYSYLILSPSASSVFESNLIQNTDSASLEFGFSPIRIPFGDVRPGDWIRFEHDKTRTFNIIGVGAYEDFVSGSTDYPNLVTFKITPNIGKSNIAPGAQINHFVIYRIINDGTYVILDVNKDIPGGAYSGIIQPEYVSEQLTNNYDKIIQNLTEKEIIQ
jgi:hypothetical protein